MACHLMAPPPATHAVRVLDEGGPQQGRGVRAKTTSAQSSCACLAIEQNTLWATPTGPALGAGVRIGEAARAALAHAGGSEPSAPPEQAARAMARAAPRDPVLGAHRGAYPRRPPNSNVPDFRAPEPKDDAGPPAPAPQQRTGWRGAAVGYLANRRRLTAKHVTANRHW
eukprot:CAMPEP_0174319364 /NCGR_PEP_ID=MMETSP0810-20121108/8817_1 /TAXON_ID=73025 ORGANISM="Eutreptiella gymnastica-like, Strain CCMP1594" /NCGR_SAMPLE_ID=MMETSP0810 /ASSEMBLY_ACC=CAM_ASM_000659 /LENGTH=168 /DNA_ID=CAMNT_0015429885 /DNA_START=500 /DNA_END=1005 /DNA_ORIENTATION=-